MKKKRNYKTFIDRYGYVFLYRQKLEKVLKAYDHYLNNEIILSHLTLVDTREEVVRRNKGA